MNATDAKQPVADLAFGEVVFDVTVSGGVRWLRGLQIATALGYKNPSVDIKNLHARNADEFTPDMTVTVPIGAPVWNTHSVDVRRGPLRWWVGGQGADERDANTMKQTVLEGGRAI